jgi:hypothetical protein
VWAGRFPQAERHVRQGIDPPGGEGGEFSEVIQGPIPVSGNFFGFRIIEDVPTAFAFGWRCRVEGGLFLDGYHGAIEPGQSCTRHRRVHGRKLRRAATTQLETSSDRPRAARDHCRNLCGLRPLLSTHRPTPLASRAKQGAPIARVRRVRSPTARPASC